MEEHYQSIKLDCSGYALHSLLSEVNMRKSRMKSNNIRNARTMKEETWHQKDNQKHSVEIVQYKICCICFDFMDFAFL